MKSYLIQQQDTAVCAIFASTSFLRVSMLCVAIGFALAATPASAQSSTALTAVYGRGVHAYFAGNTSAAEQYFTEVIQAGSTDPRPYYFRGVLRLRQGRQFEAENDMRIGAAYEARNPGVQNSIGRALQRVQGPSRRTLEKFRRQARLDRVQQGRQRTQLRYEQLERRAPQVLREGTQLPLNQPVQPPRTVMPGSGAKPAGSGTVGSGTQGSGTQGSGAKVEAAQPGNIGSATKADDDDLFGTPAPVTPADDPFGGTPESAAPTPAPADDPFGDLPSPAAEEADPFGESSEEMPAEEVTTPADDDLFGESEPAESSEADPFGESSSDDEMEAVESADSAPAEDDPFGESTDAAEEAPAEDAAEDPFGESSSSDDAPADDPFGESSSDMADEDDPFGESTDSADDAPADESDPFGESAEAEDDSAPADDSSESSDEAVDEAPADDSDPFGPFGGRAPAGQDDAFAQPSLTPAANAGPGGELFFALGQWLGSRGNAVSQTMAGRSAVAQADFELGPSDAGSAKPATAEMALEEDPFGAPSSADESAPAADDPFGDDPFGDDPFGE